jgi:hypothetical protein
LWAIRPVQEVLADSEQISSLAVPKNSRKSITKDLGGKKPF